MGRGNFEGKGYAPPCPTTPDVNCAKTAEPIQVTFCLWTRMGPRKRKWLNQSICRFVCGLGWDEGSTSSIVFAGLRQYALVANTIEPLVCVALCEITLSCTIRKTDNMNRDEGSYQLSHVWDKLLHTDDRHRKSVLMKASSVKPKRR